MLISIFHRISYFIEFQWHIGWYYFFSIIVDECESEIVVASRNFIQVIYCCSWIKLPFLFSVFWSFVCLIFLKHYRGLGKLFWKLSGWTVILIIDLQLGTEGRQLLSCPDISDIAWWQQHLWWSCSSTTFGYASIFPTFVAHGPLYCC